MFELAITYAICALAALGAIATVGDDGARINRRCDPDAGADNGAVADASSTAEYGGIGIDYTAVSYIGVSLYTLYRVSVLVELKALCAECNTLIVVVSPITIPVPWSMKK